MPMVRGRYGDGMQELRLFAIGINDVRDIFGADAPLAARLRDSAARHFAAPPHPRSLLSKLGPVFSRHPQSEVDPQNPLRSDVDALLAGGHIPVERLVQCWQVLLAWLGDLSAQSLDITLDGLEALEFDLALAGLPSDFSVRRLASRELGTPLRPLPHQVVGYSKHQHVVETYTELRQVHDDAGPGFATTMHAIEPLMGLLGGIAARPAAMLDLVVVQIPG
ncbi:hypothetical protein [Tessaracoccus antarcticus]|uniref:hypothetical protein n=1 Tax=Tessaracoccus antarcticus TaxID=2479848 RepID=UPI0011C36E7F|nr:hypothetical protein [Tessaracoccus antarcticus]